MAGNFFGRAAAYARYLIVRAVYRPMERLGVHVTPVHFYEPIPDSRELLRRPGLWESESELPGIDINADEQLRLLREVFPGFKEEYSFQLHGPPLSQGAAGGLSRLWATRHPGESLDAKEPQPNLTLSHEARY